MFFFSSPAYSRVCFLLSSFAESIAWSPGHFVVLLKKCVQYKICSVRQYAMWQMFCPNWISPLSNKLIECWQGAVDYFWSLAVLCVFIETDKRKLKRHVICLSDGGQSGGTRQLLSGVQKAVSRLVQNAVCRKTHHKFQKRRLCWEIKCTSQFVFYSIWIVKSRHKIPWEH